MRHRRFGLLLLIVILTVAGCQTAATSMRERSRVIRLATTTSTYDSGLLTEIIPDFENESGYQVEIIAVGTGQALALGEAGDVDVLLVHARALENEFIEAGFGTQRYDVMYNDFILLGPPSNPANITDNHDIVLAFSEISTMNAPFVSRGDDSGTHAKERLIWEQVNVMPSGDWYLEAGQGMGAVLTMADEQEAYTLSDRGTYIARAADGLDIVIIVEGDPLLANPYSVIPVNPAVHPHANMQGAREFVEWITSLETQQAIAAFQVNDQQLFFPDSEAYRQFQE